MNSFPISVKTSFPSFPQSHVIHPVGLKSDKNLIPKNLDWKRSTLRSTHACFVSFFHHERKFHSRVSTACNLARSTTDFRLLAIQLYISEEVEDLLLAILLPPTSSQSNTITLLVNCGS